MPMLPALLVLLFLLPIDAHAQSMGGMPRLSPQEIEEARASCEALGRIPNPPMSVAVCKAMLSIGAALDTAAADPTARRPGDETMSCAAIFAEMTSLAGVGISEATATRAAAVVTDATTLSNRQAGELGAFIAESYAMGTVAGAMGAFTPNFVGAAIAAAWQAKFAALAARQATEQAPVRARTNDVLTASIRELEISMEANPRFARLAQLGITQNCEPPAGAPR
jgi:hypothetical protein